MGSAEGFGGSGSGSVVVSEVRQQAEGAFRSKVHEDETRAVSASLPAFWSKSPDSELCREGCQSSRLQDDNAPEDQGLGNTNSPAAPCLEAKLVVQRSGKIVKNSSGCAKRSEMQQMEVLKSKDGLHDVNGFSTALASSPASNFSEKIQIVKQKNINNCRRGDKRNSKVHKNKCHPFSLKNGLVGFNSAAGGNNFFGIYGLKSDVFDITKHVSELSIDDLLHGHCNYSSTAKDKGKKVANSNNNLLQSVRKACSVLQDQKVFQAQKYAEIDGCIQKVSTEPITASHAAAETDCDKGNSGTAELSFDKIKNSGDNVKTAYLIADSPLYLPKDIMERLTLPPPKDLDSLISDGSKTTSSSKSSTDPRLGKSFSQRNGLPPFPWSHSLSGHNKLGADSVKSTSRTMCHGRWFKVKNSNTLQKGSTDLILDIESLTFDQSLVPKVNCLPENETAPVERLLSCSAACSTSMVLAEEHSPTYAAAKTLCDMAIYSSKESLGATVKMLKKPSQMGKLKASVKSSKLVDASKSTMRPHSPAKVGYDGSPCKKLRLSTKVTSAYDQHTESAKRGTLNWSCPQSITSSPRKQLYRDSNAGTDSSSVNLVNKSRMMRPPRGTDRPSNSQQKLREIGPMKWSRPEG